MADECQPRGKVGSDIVGTRPIPHFWGDMGGLGPIFLYDIKDFQQLRSGAHNIYQICLFGFVCSIHV